MWRMINNVLDDKTTDTIIDTLNRSYSTAPSKRMYSIQDLITKQTDLKRMGINHSIVALKGLRAPMMNKLESVFKGDKKSCVFFRLPNDQYDRAEVWANKEIIAQGREPTPQNTKLANGMDTLNVDIKKIESDYFNPRINNVDKVYQEIPTDDSEVREYTKEKDTLDNVKLSDRLDPIMLDPFKENPYTHSLSSFAY